ncbi:hypothetical protein C8Q73DRAFT_720093 [Cubamyces lactineus]|nr:hypothetical protein C8Q73DRAFT_720093 [Cubamyces lactineus]
MHIFTQRGVRLHIHGRAFMPCSGPVFRQRGRLMSVFRTRMSFPLLYPVRLVSLCKRLSIF